ncbi:MAG: sulfatase family protein, partial [Bacteroidales bacterium]
QTSPDLYPLLPNNQEKTEGLDSRQKLPYQNFTNDYWRRYRFIYHRLVELVDNQIGKVLQAIDQSAIADNTLIIFTSDHGEMAGSHRLRTKNAPYAECQKVPLVFYGKGVAGQRSDHSAVCNGMDLLPTLCELGGIDIPANLFGKSLAERIKKEGAPNNSRTLFLEGAQFYQILADDNFKYTCFTTPPYAEILIDLRTDPYETVNRTEDPTLIDILKTLRKQMNEELAKRAISTRIHPTTGDKHPLSVTLENEQLIIGGLDPDETLSITGLNGVIVYQKRPKTGTVYFDLKNKGCYLIATPHEVCKVCY